MHFTCTTFLLARWLRASSAYATLISHHDTAPLALPVVARTVPVLFGAPASINACIASRRARSGWEGCAFIFGCFADATCPCHQRGVDHACGSPRLDVFARTPHRASLLLPLQLFRRARASKIRSLRTLRAHFLWTERRRAW